MDKSTDETIIELTDENSRAFIDDIGLILLANNHTGLETLGDIADRTYWILESWHKIMRLSEDKEYETEVKGTLHDWIEHVLEKNYLLELFLEKVEQRPEMDPVTQKIRTQLETLELMLQRKHRPH